MQNELKPCPFCGGEAKLHGESFFVVVCNNDLCSASTNVTNRTESINAWNTRQPAFDWKPIEELTEEILTAKEKIPFIMMYQAKEPDFYHKYGSIGIFILAKNDNDEFLICSNSSNWTVPLSKISETVFTHYKIITPPQTNQS